MTTSARYPDMRRASVMPVLAAGLIAALAGTVSCQAQSPVLSSSDYVEDFDSAWTFIRNTYAYLDEKAVDWARVRELLRPRVAEVRDTDGFIGLLEDLVEHLYDHHAHLGVNTSSSPRLVPTGADLWAEHQHDLALITQVRAGSDAERVGLQPGMEWRSWRSMAVRFRRL